MKLRRADLIVTIPCDVSHPWKGCVSALLHNLQVANLDARRCEVWDLKLHLDRRPLLGLLALHTAFIKQASERERERGGGEGGVCVCVHAQRQRSSSTKKSNSGSKQTNKKKKKEKKGKGKREKKKQKECDGCDIGFQQNLGAPK